VREIKVMLKNLTRIRVIVGLLAIVIVTGLVAGCGGEDNSAGTAAPGEDSARNSDEVLSLDGGSSEAPLPAVDRKIQRTATLELSVDDVATSVQTIDDIATDAGGFVSGSSVFVDERGDADRAAARRTQAGTVTIRIPADAYSSVMKQLRGIATEVVSETSDASEVTEEYTDLEARLRNLNATEASYLTLLAQATAIPDILTVQDRLNSVRLEIEQVQGRINVLDDLTDLATITVRLNQPPAVVESRGWVQKAWEASLTVAEGAMMVGVTIAIFAGVSLLWVVPLVLVIAITWRLFGRRIAVSLHRLLSVN
jgi:hypothetical protein